VPAALAAAAAARDEAEAGIAAAAADLEVAYRTFACGAAAALARWESLGAAPLPWVPPPRRALPTARDELLLALDGRWLYGRQRCDAASKQLQTFGSRGIGAAAAPRGEAARLRGLAQAVHAPQVRPLFPASPGSSPPLLPPASCLLPSASRLPPPSPLPTSPLPTYPLPISPLPTSPLPTSPLPTSPLARTKPPPLPRPRPAHTPRARLLRRWRPRSRSWR
jgi:hypothetical protein